MPTGPPSYHGGGRGVLPTPNLSTLAFPAGAKYTDLLSKGGRER